MVQGCGVGPGGVTWPDWAQCVSEAWAHAWMYKISTRYGFHPKPLPFPYLNPEWTHNPTRSPLGLISLSQRGLSAET